MYKLYASINCLPSDIAKCIDKTNCDLHNLFQWASIIWLCRNPRKSKVLTIGNVNSTAQLTQFQINNTTIETVHNDKNLEVIFNNSFNWFNHVKMLFVVKRLPCCEYFNPFIMYGCELSK